MVLRSGDIVSESIGSDFRNVRETSVAKVLVSEVPSYELRVDDKLCFDGVLRMELVGRDGDGRARTRVLPDFEKE
jgi:hypothetical protein